MLNTSKLTTASHCSHHYADGGAPAEQRQESHMRKQYLDGQLSEADQETYRKQFGDPQENEANEQLRHAQHQEWVREQREREQQ